MSNCEKSRSGKKFVVHNAFWDECEAIIEELETSFLEELVEAKKRELERCHHPSAAEENTYNVSNVQQVMKIQSNHTDKNRSNKKKGKKKKNKKKRASSTSSSSSVSSTSSSEDQFQSKSRRSRSRIKSRSKSVVRSKDPSRPHSRARSPQRSRDRSRPYSRSRSRSKSLLRFRGRSRSKTRPHSRNRSPSFQRKHSRSPISRRRHSRSPFLDRSRSRSKPHRYDQHSRSRSKSRSKTSERQLGNQFGGSRKNGFPGRGRGHGRGRGGGWQGGSKKSYQHNSPVSISDDESEAIVKPTLNGRFSPPKALNTNNAGNDDWDDFFGGGSATQNPHQRNPPQRHQSPPRPVEVVQPTRIVVADSDDEFNEFFGTKKVARSPPRKQNNRDPRLQNLPPPINDSAMTQAISHALQEDNDPFFAPSTSKMTYIDFSPIQVPRAPPKRLSPLPNERDSHGSAEVFHKDVDFASVRAPKAPPKMLSPLPEEPVSVPYMNEDEPSKNTGADTDYSDCEMELEFPELSPQSGEVNEEALPTVEKVPPLLEKSFVSWDEPPPIASIVSKGATPMEKEASPTVEDASLNTAQSPSMTNEVSPIAAPEATKEATSPLSEALLLNEAASQILSSEIQTELQGAAPNPAPTIEEPPEGSPIEPGTPLQDENEPSVNEAAITFENNQEDQRSSTPLEDEEYDLTQEPPTKETTPPSSGTPLRDEQAFDSVLEPQNNDNPIGNEAITVATPSVEINSDESLLLYIDEASKDSHSQWLDYPLEENSSPLANAEEPTSNEQAINLALDPKTKEIPAGNVAIPEADESSKDSLTQLADYHLADVGPPTISDEELAAIVRQNKLLEEQPPASPVVDLTGDSPVVRQFVREKTATPPPRKTQLVLTVTDDEVTESFVPVSPEKRLDKEVLAFSPASAAGKENQNLSNSQEEFFM